jgi:hypothetical protein
MPERKSLQSEAISLWSALITVCFRSMWQAGQRYTISSSDGDSIAGAIVLIFIGAPQRQQIMDMGKSCGF